MIVELALLAAAGSALLGVASAVRARRSRTAASTSELGKALAAARALDRGLVSGDVLMIPGEELALGGALHLHEGGPVLRAFALVGGERDRWLVQLDEAGRDLVLARETDLVGDGHVSSELAAFGRVLTLERRGTARVSATGEDVPRADGALAPYVVLGERGGRAVIVLDLPGRRVALAGERLDPRVVDRLGGGAR